MQKINVSIILYIPFSNLITFSNLIKALSFCSASYIHQGEVNWATGNKVHCSRSQHTDIQMGLNPQPFQLWTTIPNSLLKPWHVFKNHYTLLIRIEKKKKMRCIHKTHMHVTVYVSISYSLQNKSVTFSP